MRRGFIVLPFALLCGSAFAQISLTSFSDFNDGTTQGWGGPNAFNVPTGGPNGAGDGYLGVTSTGTGQGSRLATYNTDWIGDYRAAGVTGITAMIQNPNAVPLELRIVLFDLNTNARWTSANPVIVAANSGWVNATFSLAEADLTRVLGTSDYNSVITNVSRLMIRHDAGSASQGGTMIEGELRMDNIRAVPEPASMTALGLGALALLRRRRK